MPIDEKEQMMRQQARDYIRRDTFILTNIGEFKLPPSMEPYVADYSAILPCAFQPFGVLVSSYKDTLKVSISQRDFNYHLSKTSARCCARSASTPPPCPTPSMLPAMTGCIWPRTKAQDAKHPHNTKKTCRRAGLFVS